MRQTIQGDEPTLWKRLILPVAIGPLGRALCVTEDLDPLI